MNCPTADKLSQFVDQLLPKQEMAETEAHVQSCASCGKVVNAFQEEQRFIEETLQTPTLPGNFTELVLDQLEPYGKSKKQRKAVWKRVVLTAVGIVLAVGIGATVNPAFAQLISGLFTSNQVDEGLQKAAEAGLTQRLNLEVEDQGLTFVVEDVIADSSRVTLSYKILDESRKPQKPNLNIWNADNKYTAIDQNGNIVDMSGIGWPRGSDYGYIEFSLFDHSNHIEKLTIQFNLVELNGVQGNWQLQVPVDLNENRKLTKMVELQDATAVHHGVEIDLKKLHIAPSAMELFFETSLAKEELQRAEEAKRKLEERFGKEKMDSLVIGDTSGIAYHIENAAGNIIYSTERSTDSEIASLLRGSSEDTAILGRTTYAHSFVPKNEDQLTFVLDGVFKKEQAGFSVVIKPKDIERHPLSLDYKGYHLTVKSVEKSLVEAEDSVIIKLEGKVDFLDAGFGSSWMVVDEIGKVYPGKLSSGSMSMKGKDGRHDISIELELDGLQEVPEQLTLHLLYTTNYYPADNQWRVPLTN
ncbi:DUF4179 domain-containing protein [Sporosarcina sp. 179-K 8C2 HS]|uniref:DUF4179 domain-containing protein n=1 Tax=Sporosarcina sp. 179-K 8C2 HS TaxID=3142387 RepID=UPI00399F1AD7